MSKLTIEEVGKWLEAILEPSAVVDKAAKRPLEKSSIFNRLLNLARKGK